MSANNFILIKKEKKRYQITHCDADTGCPLDETYEEKSALSALRRASKLVDKIGEVEYGITFVE